MKRPTYLELGRRTAFGRPVKKPVPPQPPPPDPKTVMDFDLGTWRVRPSLGRMTRADRIVALDEQTLQVLLILAERPAGGVNRDALAMRVFGPADPQDHGTKLRRCLGLLRRVFSEDGAVRLVNAPGDCFVLEIGAPVPGRGLRSDDSGVLLDNPGAIEAWTRRDRRRGIAIGLAALIVIAIAAFLVTIIDRGHVVLFGTVAEVRPLATEPGSKTSPSFSPDGRQVVYAWRTADGSARLYVRGTAGGAPRALTAGGPDSYPAWSPRGNLVAFQRRAAAGCSVMVVAPDGSGEHRIGDCDYGGGGPMTWLRDGSALIYTHRTAWYLPTQLVSLNVASGKMVGVTNPVSGMPGDSAPALAANGRRLVFMRTRAPGAADLQLIELSVGIPERVTHDLQPTAGAAWEPAGLSIVFSSARGGHEALWRSRLDGAPTRVVLARGEDLRAPALSNDGRQLAFEHWHVASRFARLGVDPAAAPAAPWRSAAAHERGAQLSPDQGRVVFVSDRGGHDQLWIAPVTGGEAKQLTRSELDYLETPRWSPDSRYITYTAASDGRFDVWVVEVATGRPERVTDDGRSRAPSFSRDGRWLYFGSAGSGSWQIWRRAWPAGGAPEQLTTDGGLAAIEARDGDSLYYVRPDRNGLWQRPREPGGDDTLISGELAPVDWRNWDVTADAIWFVTRPSDAPPLLAHYSLLDGRVTHGQPVPALLPDSGLTLAPDGHALLGAETASERVDIEIAKLD